MTGKQYFTSGVGVTIEFVNQTQNDYDVDIQLLDNLLGDLFIDSQRKEKAYVPIPSTQASS